MSVLQIKGRTTNSQDVFDKYSLSSNSNIYTTAAASNIEEYSIELSLGDGWNDNYSISDKGLIRVDGSIVVKGHGSIVVEVKEEIRVPHNRYGIVLPTGSLFLSRGVLVASAKVEPAFIGKLKLRLFNTTSQKVVLTEGEKLGSVIFFPTESTKVHNATYRTSEISSVPKSKISEMNKWFGANKTIWIGWLVTMISSSMLAFFLSYVFYYKPMLQLQSTQQNQVENGKQDAINEKEKQPELPELKAAQKP
ncbi:Deoxycytidine triphosphate deaminase [Ferriphaselus amnicola]|uniref:Deoxycytidine triphosphate deaminase n=1 Tax=Ferriphaselus amnicola TaxID=1188319 RepID=A0A2Z6GAT2_9PROT|nr:dUTP pyrophosphatase [Ferriphaselus amnicola]BBE50681.1 Deoxycytidine triphosphate deaminase [Ferriphaselus amnicola]